MHNRKNIATKQEVHIELPAFIYDEIVPYFESKIDIIKNHMVTFLETGPLDKSSWVELYNIVDDIITLYENHEYTTLISYDRKYFTAKYAASHSQYYMIHGSEHAKYCLNQIQQTENQSSDIKTRCVRLRTAMTHLFYFVTMQEKLTSTTPKE